MSDIQIDAWVKDMIKRIQQKQARERAYILSQNGKPKSRSFKKLVKEQPIIDEILEFFEYYGGEGNESN